MILLRLLKRAVMRALALPTLARTLRPLTRGCVSILMLHRFTDGDPAIAGHSVAELRALLEAVRRWRLPVLSVPDLVRLAEEGARVPEGAVVFTVDDGYADFAQLAEPIFAAFDCPVTVFLATGFIDGRLWLWFDQVTYAFAHSPRQACEMTVGPKQVRYAWRSAVERTGVAANLTERLKRVEEAERRRLVAELTTTLDVEVPAVPPPLHRALTWDEVRRAAASRASFGPHTVSHPILSRTDDAHARREICESWARVRAETDAAVPVFAYPNGDADSFGIRERVLVAEAGLRLALTGGPGYATTSHLALDRSDAYAVPRFACPTDTLEFGELALGLERLRGCGRTGRRAAQT